MIHRTPAAAAAALLAVACTTAPADSTPSAAAAASAPDPRSQAFSTEFPYEPRYVEVLGARMHYVDEGEGQVFLFLHGNPTSSYLWRNVMPHVAPFGRVVAPDNIGFGRSDKPDIDYTLQDHMAYTDGFIDALKLTDIILIMHDWGSGVGLSYARRHPDNVKGVVMMEAITPPSFPAPEAPPPESLFGRFRTDGVGQELIMEQNVFIDQLLGNATATRAMPEAAMDVYRAPFPTPESRYPVYVWPNELPMGGEPARNVAEVEAYGEWLMTSPTPKLVQYASPGAIISPDDAVWMAANYSNTELQFIGYGNHYIQEDNPEAIGRGIVEWARRTFD